MNPKKSQPPPSIEWKDSDRDGISDRRELVQGSDPRYRDTDRDGVEDLKEKRQHSNPRIRQQKNYIDITREEFRSQYSRILCQLHGWTQTSASWRTFCSDLNQMGGKLKEIYGQNWDVNVANEAFREKIDPQEICYILSQSPYLKTAENLTLEQKQNYSTAIVEKLLQKEKEASLIKTQPKNEKKLISQIEPSDDSDDDDFDLFS